jgi:hypothetical protein
MVMLGAGVAEGMTIVPTAVAAQAGLATNMSATSSAGKLTAPITCAIVVKRPNPPRPALMCNFAFLIRHLLP